MKITRSLLLLASLVPVVGQAQEIQFLFAEYNNAIYQNGPTASIPMGQKVDWNWQSYGFWAGIAASGDLITGPTMTGPSIPGGEALPWWDGAYELEYEFATKSAMTSAVIPGAYTFSATNPAFSETIQIPAYSQLPDQLFTAATYTAMQSFDPTQELTIEWLPFTAGQGDLGGSLDLQIDYWDDTLEVPASVTVFSWEPDLEFDDNGLSPATATSVIVPANTLVGSPYNSYTIVLYSMRVDSFDPAVNVPGAIVANVTSIETVLEAHAQETTGPLFWAGYPIVSDIYVDTSPWLGWLDVSKTPWIWSLSLSSWMYLPEENVSAGGAWVYIPN